jgi:MYXO-CTERM domain-containing protein
LVVWCGVLGRALCWLLVITCLAAPAFAQSAEGIEPADGGRSTDVVALEAQLEAGLAELAAIVPVDCAAACEALASLRRAAMRICELDPGAPCEAARRKLEEAERRVREACDCTLERQKETIAPKKGGLSQPGDGEPDDDAAPEAAPALASAPPSEQRGGCASCAVGHDGGPGGVFGLGLGLALLLPVWIRRRRR